MMAFRNSVNSTAGFTPAMLTFGHELRIPLDIVYGKCPHEECDYTEYVSELRKRLHIAFEKVHENTVLKDGRKITMIKMYQERRSTWAIE